MGLDHVALTVADRERSAVFYGEHFGLTERVHDDAHRLILGDATARCSPSRRASRRPAAQNHFGFRLDGAAACAPRASACARPPCPRRSGRTTGDFVRVQVADPDGYLVDLYS